MPDVDLKLVMAEGDYLQRVGDELVGSALDERYGAYSDVRNFGVECDGVTDDTAAVQAALDAMSNGGSLVFPGDARVKISNTLTLTVNGSADWVDIDMNGATFVWAGVGGKPMFQFSGTALTGIEVRPLTLRRARFEGNSIADVAVKLTDANLCRFDDIQVLNTVGPAFDLLISTGRQSENCEYSRVIVRNSGGVARLTGLANDKSYARSRWEVFGSAMTASAIWFDVTPNARAYDSEFKVRGNCGNGQTIFRWQAAICRDTFIEAHLEAGSAATLIDFNNSGVESPVIRGQLGSGTQIANTQTRRVLSSTYVQEVPPLGQLVGALWMVPSVNHSAWWDGAAWKPITPTTAAANVCCVLAKFAVLYDARDGGGTALWRNIGSLGNTGFLATEFDLTVTGATRTAKGYTFDGVNDDASTLGTVNLNFGATESFTMLAVLTTGAAFVNNAPIFTKRTSLTGTSAGWYLATSATASTDSKARFLLGDGAIATSPALSPAMIPSTRTVLVGVRDVTADTITCYANGVAGTPVTDTTTATLTNAVNLRVGRIGAAYGAVTDSFLFGVARSALTAAEVTLLQTWDTARAALP